ncbi:MAG: glycosyltransferase [Fimbriimonadaceae bacterium]|nr:glycosyltransferase [Fimbriimonadaceae bacterium]
MGAASQLAKLTNVVIAADYAYVAGGAEKVAIQSAVGLADSGLRVVFLAAIGPVCEELRAHPGITVHCLNQSKVGDSSSKVKATMAMIKNPAASSMMRSILDGLSPQETVVHFHSFMGGLSASPVLAARDGGFKVFYTVHDYGLACPQQSFFDHDKMGICQLKPLSLACCTRPCTGRGLAFKGAVTLRAMANRRRHVADAFSAYAFVSDFSGDIIRPYLAKRPMRWVPNPIDVQDRGVRELQPDAPYLFVGRLTMEKDPRTFLEACRFVGVGARVVGDGPLKESLVREFPKAEFMPWMSSAEVTETMRRSRALVFPSIWYEASPLVSYEAAANGLPVISADANASRETVETLGCGLVFRAGDAEDLASKLRVFEDDAVCEGYGKQGYETYWKQPMTLTAHVDALLVYYRDVMGGTA